MSQLKTQLIRQYHHREQWNVFTVVLNADVAKLTDSSTCGYQSSLVRNDQTHAKSYEFYLIRSS